MESAAPIGDPWVLRAGRWLTKRRGILLAPVFTVALLSARKVANPWVELIRHDLLGILCLMAGIRLRMVAASYHDSADHAEPITAGPYAWVRHPLYLANFLLGLGVLLVAGWWPMLVLYAAFFLVVHLLIARSEEVHLARQYGERYETYRSAVPAILPWRRFRGRIHGSRSDYKLKEGREGLKAGGYAAGVVALLLIKRWRDLVQLPPLHPLGTLNVLLLAAVPVLMVICRPRIRLAWLRASQTVLATAVIVFMALHVPGVWPAGRTPFAPPPSSPPITVPARESIGGEADAGVPHRHAPASQKPRWNLAAMMDGLWEHLEVIGGASTFGIATLVEAEKEGEGTFRSQLSQELGEAGQAALGVALAISVWRQFRQTTAMDLVPGDPEPWQCQVRPVLEEHHNVALVASFKRRF